MGTNPTPHKNPERETAIEDEGSLHPYRTEIPNTVVRGLKSRGLSVYAKWLYVYFKSVAGDGSVCYRNTTTIATESGMSRGQVSAAKKELVTQGLITLKPGKNPHRDPDHVRMRNIWLANMQEFSVHVVNTDENEESQETTSPSSSGVHTVNTASDGHTPSVHTVNAPVFAEVAEMPSPSSSSVHHMNTGEASDPAQCSYSERGVHTVNTSVHVVNQRRSLEEDPSKKGKEPPSLTLPPGGMEEGDATAASFNRPAQLQTKEVLAHLILVSGIAYSTSGMITRRLAEGASVQDCMLVIDWWGAWWSVKRPDQRDLLDPTTPFKGEKFQEYLAKARQWAAQGRLSPPPRTQEAHVQDALTAWAHNREETSHAEN